jgi:hypothetical protein
MGPTQWLLPHWLILAGSAIALLGTIGLLFGQKPSEDEPPREPPQRITSHFDA